MVVATLHTFSNNRGHSEQAPAGFPWQAFLEQQLSCSMRRGGWTPVRCFRTSSNMHAMNMQLFSGSCCFRYRSTLIHVWTGHHPEGKVLTHRCGILSLSQSKYTTRTVCTASQYSFCPNVCIQEGNESCEIYDHALTTMSGVRPRLIKLWQRIWLPISRLRG